MHTYKLYASVNTYVGPHASRLCALLYDKLSTLLFHLIKYIYVHINSTLSLCHLLAAYLASIALWPSLTQCCIFVPLTRLDQRLATTATAN